MKTVEVKVLGAPGEETVGSAEFRPLSIVERCLKGTGVAIAFFIAAGISIVIPVLHFLLVPGLFVVGLICGARKCMERGTIEKASASCPGCKAALVLPNKLFRPSCYLECPGCKKHLFAQFSL
jgi:hypothetical protein